MSTHALPALRPRLGVEPAAVVTRAATGAAPAAPGPLTVGPLTVGPLTGVHSRWVADLQLSDLAHGLFPRLGRRFVRAWHAAHMDSPHAVGLVALRDGVPVGFALGSSDRRAHVDWLLAHRRGPLLRAGALALLARPHVLVHFLATRGRRYARRLLPGGLFPARRAEGAGTPGAAGTPGPAPAASGAAPIAVLEAIVVLGTSRRAGIGTALLDGFVESVAARGTARVELVTKAGAAGAAGFYDRRGWTRTGDHVDRDGDTVHTYRLEPAPERHGEGGSAA